MNSKKVLVLEASVEEERSASFVGGFGLNITPVDIPDYRTMVKAVA